MKTLLSLVLFFFVISAQAAEVAPEQVECVGEAFIGQASAEARMSKVDVDEFKMQLIITEAQLHDKRTLLAKSVKRGLDNVDWIYAKNLSPSQAYIDVYKKCAIRHGKHLTQAGSVLKHSSVTSNP